MSEGVAGRPAQYAVIIEDAAPYRAGCGAVVLPDGGEDKSEFVDGGLEANPGEGFGKVLEGSHSL